MIKNTKIKSTIKILLGIIMVASVIAGYAPLPHTYWAEFTGISNFSGGIVLIADGFMELKGKSVPKILHLNVSVGILFVFLACLASFALPEPFNFGGAFLFLHVINPVLFVLCYIFLCRDEAESTVKHLLAAPVLTAAYFIFDYILGNIRGFFVYGFFMPETLSVMTAAIIEIAVFLLLMLFGAILFALNRKANNS